MKTWITLRMEDGRPPAAAVVGTVDVTDEADVTHAVTYTLPLDLPDGVREALSAAAEKASPALVKALSASPTDTLAAINSQIRKGLAAKAKAALRAAAA